MKLSQCTLGVLVTDAARFLIPGTQRLQESAEPRRIGHVVGLSVNPTGEVIPVVQFACRKEPLAIHHANLEPLTD